MLGTECPVFRELSGDCDLAGPKHRRYTNEGAVLWEKVAGRCPRSETIRSLQILTGGSPRLLAIVARFEAGRSFRALMADLIDRKVP